MMKNARMVAIAAVLILTACGGSEEGTGGVTQEEAEQLNEAAEMLDASPDSLVASDETGLGNGEDADAATGDLPVSEDAATDEQ
jgi:hypothetical protein